MSMQNEKPLALIVGAGPGLGVALAEALMSRGYKVVGLNRTHYEAPCEEMTFLTLDTCDQESTGKTLAEVQARFGVPAVVIHNTAQLYIKPFLDTAPEEFENAWRSMVMSAINSLQSVLPGMTNAGTGTVIVSGATASLRGSANFAAFSSAKFALRGLTQSLAREYQKQGVHIAHVILDGVIDTGRSRELHSKDPATMMKVEDLAQIYLQIIDQPRSTWSHELDLRPASETF